MVIYQDRIEAELLTEPGSLNDLVERLAYGLKDSASELEPVLHSRVPDRLPVSHLGYQLLQFHMVYAPMDSYQGETVLTDMDAEIAKVDLYYLIIGFHFKPESTGHRHLVCIATRNDC